jgi:ribosomal protein S27AE
MKKMASNHPDQIIHKLMALPADKLICSRCGKSKAQRLLEPAFDTGINHPEYRYSKSFMLSYTGRVTCPECHKEEELESLFKLMDARDAKNIK